MQKSTFLLEIGTEELPPKQLRKIADAFSNGFLQALKANSLEFKTSKTFASPRRIALQIEDLEYQQESKVVEVQGPFVTHAFDENGDPKPAAIGFAKKLGLNIEQLERIETPKGQRLVAKQQQIGKKLPDLLENLCFEAFKSLPQQRWMRWSDKEWTFIRPAHWIVALYGKDVIPFELFGIESSNTTKGHRFLGEQAIVINSAENYENILKNSFVIASLDKRKEIITKQVAELEAKEKLTAIFDEELLEEATNLVEWPNIFMGEFKKEFLDVPKEALTSSMQSHQKSFPLQDANHKLTNKFVIISNMKVTDPKNIIEGNQRVINARLSDAAFFFTQDRKSTLESNAEALKNMVFFEGLGTIYDKAQRISKLSKMLSATTGAKESDVEAAGRLAKADLASEMVYEFPELQGIMGKYYAINDGLTDNIAIAIEEHYLPKSASDALPRYKEGTTVALADRLDTLCGLFLIGKEPLKDKDPFALRRQALGVARILIEKDIDSSIDALIDKSFSLFTDKEANHELKGRLKDFIFERIKAFYKQSGIKPQLIEAAMSGQKNNPFDFSRRLNAIIDFSKTEQSASLAEANKRVRNILAKNDIIAKDLEKIDPKLIKEKQEKDLFSILSQLEEEIPTLAQDKKYSEVMNKLAQSKDVVDSFFEHVMVMSEDENIRKNRVKMLVNMRLLFSTVGDISLI